MEKRTLVTIIAESILESRLLEDLTGLGVRGYTIMQARGSGARGTRHADWDQNQNIRIEVVCDDAVAASIVEAFQRKYYENYAMVIYVSDVRVARPEKF